MKSMLLAVAALLLNAAMVAEEAQETLPQGRTEVEQEVAETPAQAAAEMTAEAEEPPFKVVIEDVPETAPASTPPAETPPVRTPETSAAVPAPAPVAAASAPSKPETPAPDPEDPALHDAAEVEEMEPNCAHALRPPRAYDREVLMLQIFLDRHNFSCGVIDGVWGEGSLEAMRAWQRSQGLRQTSWVDVPLYVAIATMPEAIVRYVITPEDVALVTGPMPATWAERAQLRLMGYETLGACIAERFHTSERTLRRLNPAIINWPEDLQAGTILNVPNVCTAALEKPAHLVVALKECVLAGFDAKGVMRLRFPCSIARNRAHLPDTGTLTIKNMAPAPNYTYDPSNYGQDPSVGKMIVPPGPRNPVGSRWIGLSLSGYGIHGTPRPNSVGRPESRGCFRLTNWNAEKLFELVSYGMPVEVVNSLADVRLNVPQSTVEPVAQPEAESPVSEAETPAATMESTPGTAAQ